MSSTNFDFCASEYASLFELPYIKYGDCYTILKIIGDVSGQSILDLACGEGTLVRQMKAHGARRVVGVDLSQSMITLAQLQESQQPLGVKFLCQDVLTLDVVGQFDMVTASFIFSLAHTKENLLKMVKAACANLKPGGRLVVTDDNVFLSPEKYGALQQYGFTKEINESLQEGTVVTCTLKVKNEDIVVKETYLSRDTWMGTLEAAGLTKMVWFPPEVAPEGMKLFGEAFWFDYINLPVSIFFTAIKE